MTVTKNKEENVSCACKLIKEAAQNGVNVVVLPMNYIELLHCTCTIYNIIYIASNIITTTGHISTLFRI